MIYPGRVEIVRLRFACPVPVGHRVTIAFYLASSVGSGPLRRQPHEPVVIDLETSIRYAPAWVLHPVGDVRARELSELSEEPSEALRLDRTLTGRVLACTVVSMPANDRHPIQTRLVVEPDAAAPPYR